MALVSERLSKLIISAGLFLLALTPRLFDLGRFLTADEFLWVDRSRNFLAALTSSAYRCDSVVEQWDFMAQGLACTLRTGHPGVTTMWTGSFGLWLRWLLDGRPAPLHDYVVGVATNPLDPTYIAPERLGTVLLTSLWVVAVYWLLRRLFGGQVALVGALLLALNPFLIAHARVIHHDALSTTFTTLSALTAFIYWGRRESRWWLCASGVAAGLAFISKIASLFLMPFVALTGLWFFGLRQRRLERPMWDRAGLLDLRGLVLEGLLWFAIAVITVFVVWPALWVAPIETLETVFLLGFKYTTGAHAKGNFLLGQASTDPGLLFYPVTWLYRTTPLVMVGLGGLILAGLRVRHHRNLPQPVTLFFRYLPPILLFILGYLVMLTIGEKKQERYFLPAYPWFDLIAGVGLLYLASIVSRSQEVSRRYLVSLVAAILIGNGLLVALTFPYYFTYYNPLVGGGRAAERAVTVGWGEGLDLAAGYLNTKADADRLRVASWYQSTFAPYYRGEAISYSKEKGKVLAGDYAVFYINQTQRRFPDDVLFDYFERRFPLEKTISLHGIDYAWIYPSLGVDHYIQDQSYSGIASLLAWQWVEGDRPLLPGRPTEFELYWEYLGKRPEERFFFRLVDAQNRPWAEGESQPVPGENPSLASWREGEIIYERGSLTVPLDTPPGQYRLQIGFYTQAEAVTAGELLFTVPSGEDLVTVTSPPEPAAFALPAAAAAVDRPLAGSLTLLGAAWPQEPLPPGATFGVDLYWRVEQPLPADATLHVGLMDRAGQASQGWFNLSLAETIEPAGRTWPAGAVFRTAWPLELLPDLPAGSYRLELVWPDDVEQTLSFAEIEVIR